MCAWKNKDRKAIVEGPFKRVEPESYCPHYLMVTTGWVWTMSHSYYPWHPLVFPCVYLIPCCEVRSSHIFFRHFSVSTKSSYRRRESDPRPAAQSNSISATNSFTAHNIGNANKVRLTSQLCGLYRAGAETYRRTGSYTHRWENRNRLHTLWRTRTHHTKESVYIDSPCLSLRHLIIQSAMRMIYVHVPVNFLYCYWLYASGERAKNS